MKVRADTPSLIILKQLYFFTLNIYLYMFKGPMLIYKKISLDLIHSLFDGIISHLPKRGPF